jgi:Na+/H+-dicarboxylate symporter
MKLHTKIFLGLLLGILFGGLSKLPAVAWLARVLVGIEPFGNMFIRAITMVVVPLVVASVFVGVTSLGDVRRLGRIGGKTLAYFLGTTAIGATIGLAIAGIVNVGAGLEPDVREALTSSFRDQATNAAEAASQSPSFVQMLVALVPQNPFAAAAAGDLLPLIVATCIFAAAATVVAEERRRTVVAFFQGVNDIAMVTIVWLMKLAPAAVFVLVAVTVTRFGLDLLRTLLVFAFAVLLALATHLAVTLMPLLRFGARVGIVHFFRSVSDALLLAFSTASSNATLPVSMNAARSRLGIADHIVSFTLPLGTIMNKNGSAVYKAVTAVFIAQLYGLDLAAGQLVTIVLVSTMAAFAGAGVPGSSLVTTLIVLNAIGLGPYASAGIALVVGIDRPLDMCRTTVNTIGNLVGTALIARTEARVAEPAAETPAPVVAYTRAP